MKIDFELERITAMELKNTLLISFSLWFLSENTAMAVNNVLKFQDGGRIIKSSTSCNPMNWRGNKVNSCMCCVIKHAPYEWLTNEAIQTTKNITQSCNTYCNNSVTLKTKDQLGLIEDTPATILFKTILKNKTAMEYVNMTDPVDKSSLNQLSNGNLTENGVLELLRKVKLSGNTPDTLKKILLESNLTAHEIKDEGGAQTLQLFLLRDSATGTPRFILKGLKKSLQEIENIETIRKSPLGELTYDPAKPPQNGLPALALDVHNFTYKDRHGAPHDMALINCAPGKDIRKFILDWSMSKEKFPKEKIMAEKAAYRLGNNIGYIHKKFNQEPSVVMGKTYTHGDMHPHNIFYDPENDRIIFIDNESFATSIRNPKNPSVDIMKFYGRLVATNFNPKHQYRKNIPGIEYYQTLIKPFIVGYMDGYAGNDIALRREVLLKLKEIMTNQSAFRAWLNNNKTIMNPIELYHNQQKYAKPLFDEIKKEQFSSGGSLGLKSVMANAIYWP